VPVSDKRAVGVRRRRAHLNMATHGRLVALIWAIADYVLRDGFRQW
jgi:hypothetical protein